MVISYVLSFKEINVNKYDLMCQNVNFWFGRKLEIFYAL